MAHILQEERGRNKAFFEENKRLINGLYNNREIIRSFKRIPTEGIELIL